MAGGEARAPARAGHASTDRPGAGGTRRRRGRRLLAPRPMTDRRRLVPIVNRRRIEKGLRHAACGATGREDPDSIAASAEAPAGGHRAPPSSQDGLAGPRRGPCASFTESAGSIEDDWAAIISMTDWRRAHAGTRSPRSSTCQSSAGRESGTAGSEDGDEGAAAAVAARAAASRAAGPHGRSPAGPMSFSRLLFSAFSAAWRTFLSQQPA
jgi:hypothetical protein